MFSRRGLAQAPRDMGLSQIAERDGPLSHPMAFTDACALGAFVLGVIFCAAGCVPVPPRSGPQHFSQSWKKCNRLTLTQASPAPVLRRRQAKAP